MINTNKLLNSKVGAVGAVAIVGVVGIWYAKKQAAAALGVAGDAINPVNDGNIFNQGVLAVGRKLTGNNSWTLGGAIYDATH